MKIGMPENGELLNQHFGQSKEFLILRMDLPDNKVSS